MKTKLLKGVLLVAILFTMNSCSSDSSDDTTLFTDLSMISYTYDHAEIETLELINNYRMSIGLESLEPINYISYKSEEHDNYMILNNVVSHDDFVARSQDIMSVLGAKNVGENIAYNYNTPAAALTAWLNSSSHKANIEGDYSHFGISIRMDSNGRKYYTNIFVKI